MSDNPQYQTAYNEDGTLKFDVFCRIPDPTNLTLAQLASLYKSRVESIGYIDTCDESCIKRWLLTCFIKHAIRYFNDSEHSILRGYGDVWMEEQLTAQMRVEILNDNLETLFPSGGVLYFEPIPNDRSLLKVTFHREIRCYVTGAALNIPLKSETGELNYSVETVDGSMQQPSTEHNCLLYQGYFAITVLDYCWEPSLFLHGGPSVESIAGITKGTLSKLVSDKMAQLSALTQELSLEVLEP